MGQTDESNNTTPKSQEREYSDWQRIRSVIEHENTLINYRQTWLLSSQAFLLTAFGTLLVASGKGNSNEKISILLSLIPPLGSFIGYIIQRALIAAEDYLKVLDQWWYYQLSILDTANTANTKKDLDKWKRLSWSDREERKKLINKNIKKHPPLQGWTGDESDRFFHYPVTPSLFVVLWNLIYVSIIFDFPALSKFNCEYILGIIKISCSPSLLDFIEIIAPFLCIILLCLCLRDLFYDYFKKVMNLEVGN